MPLEIKKFGRFPRSQEGEDQSDQTEKENTKGKRVLITLSEQ